MKNQQIPADYSNNPGLKVSYKAPAQPDLDSIFLSLPDIVLITTPDLRIKTWNFRAEDFFGLKAAAVSGQIIQEAIRLTFIDTNWDHVIHELNLKSVWQGDIMIDNDIIGMLRFQARINCVFDSGGAVQSLVMVFQDTRIANRSQGVLSHAEIKYRTVVESLSEGVILLKPDLTIEACNAKAAEILGTSTEHLRGRKVNSAAWNARRKDGSEFPVEEFPAIVSMRSGQELNDVIMGLIRPTGEEVWISINSRPIFRDRSTTPEAVVASFKDITSERLAWKKVQFSELMFRSFMTNSPSLAWVYDEKGNLVYANTLFMNYIGITEADFGKNIYEFSEKQVADRIQSRNSEVMATGQPVITEDTLHIEGREIHFLANWFLVPGKYGMMIGGQAIDITEKKRLENELLKEQVQIQKQVSQATIQAQEHERNMISAELHDNVNQLLISSRLFIGIARNTPDQQDELLEKATNYLLMAVDEIRALSRRMNSKVVGIVGLKESILEISNNMKKHRDMDICLDIDESLSKKLSSHHQLMIFRIVQEQTSNILKHAEADSAVIRLKHEGDMVNLQISDNGKGISIEQQSHVKGIGLINISNRVNAYNGTMEIITTPGKGCTLDIHFPVEGLSAMLDQQQ